jgi:cell wall-associated NlpC family hydrolase
MKRDPRLTPARPDLAAEHLRGEVESARFVIGRTMHVRAGLADLHGKPSSVAAIVTQALFGEDVILYEEREGWAWVQLASDGYVGYLRREALADGAAQATHRVCVNRSIVYPAADIKAPPITALPFGSQVKLKDEEGAFGKLADGGVVFMHHLKRLSENVRDFVAVAEGFLGAPYLWGGKSSLGIDCSGLVQIALAAAGIAAPRDTDLQEKELGSALPMREGPQGLRRGDLVFWKGHVGIMRDADTLLHANAHHMLVESEPLFIVRDRIRLTGGGEITATKGL